MHRDRLLNVTIWCVQAGRVCNLLAVMLLTGVLVASVLARSVIVAQLTAKYGAAADVGAILAFLRIVLLCALPVGVIVECMLRALRAILATVAAGEPFAAANAARLRTIGWMLLALQLVDLLYGALVLAARHLHIDYATWQPSFVGWFAVLVAFVLVRVFAAGTTMRDDLAGTV